MSPREFEAKLRRLLGEQLWFQNERKRLLRQFEELIDVQGERPPFRVKWQGRHVEVRRVRPSEYHLVNVESES